MMEMRDHWKKGASMWESGRFFSYFKMFDVAILLISGLVIIF